MSDADVEALLNRPEFSAIDASRFPAAAPLAGILKNDCRIRYYKPGDLIVREGDYGNSAFLILSGDARVVLQPGLPSQMLGRTSVRKKNVFSALSQLWLNPRTPEVRDVRRYQAGSVAAAGDTPENVSLFDVPNPKALFDDPSKAKPGAESVPALKDKFRTAQMRAGSFFGEIAALGRVQRTATVYADTLCEVLEMRWQALRDIKARDDIWRGLIEDSYRANQLRVHLREHPLMAGLGDEVLQKIADQTLFETYGSFEWHVSFKSRRRQGEVDDEPQVGNQGDYPDGLLLIGAGFGRVTVNLGNGKRTVTYLRDGDHYGLDELYASWQTGEETALQTSLTALGYLHVLRVPYSVLAELVFPNIDAPSAPLVEAAKRPIASDAFLEWAVEQRFINATRAMLIDTERCVRCDDCVRACSATHGGNPRFIRHGRRHGGFMVANACMHCVDPVCLIGCPTGAIHRSLDGGSVVINDDTCIGCGTCANSCPYDNIRLVEIRDRKGRVLRDPVSQEPIKKATKCDLCSTQPGGPACERACPHDALKRIDFREYLDLTAGAGQ